jgi:hypothetical protein
MAVKKTVKYGSEDNAKTGLSCHEKVIRAIPNMWEE